MSDKKKLPTDTDINVDDESLGQIVLTLEDNTEMTCDIIAMFPCTNGNNYVALLPVDDPDSDFFLYRYKEGASEDDFVLEDIEDDDEFDEASEAFDELMDDAEFDEMFEDEDDK